MQNILLRIKQLGCSQLLTTNWFNQFNERQQREIRAGIEAGLDVGAYADPKFDHDQMFEIRAGLINGVNVSIYAKPEYDWQQMSRILTGLKSGVDVRVLAKPEFNASQMAQILYGLSPTQTGVRDENHVGRWMAASDPDYRTSIDVTVYAHPHFTANQMNEIRLGLHLGLDVSSYSRVELDWHDMRDARLKLMGERLTYSRPHG